MPDEFDELITWEALGTVSWRKDYDEGYFIRSRRRSGNSRCTQIEMYLLRGLQVLRALGVYTKKWEDGELVEHEVFDLEALTCSTLFEFRETGWLFKRHCLSAVWFPRKHYRFSRYHKTVTQDELDEWTAAQPTPPRIVLCKSATPGTVNCHLEQSWMQVQRGTGLRLSIPLDDQQDWLSFERFIKEIGSRIQLAEDYRVSNTTLESLPGPLRDEENTP